MLIKVKVFPKSKKGKIIKKAKDSFEVFVKEKPERGMATQKVKEVLTSYFNIPENKIRLIRGAKKRNKIFEIIKK